MNGNWLGDHEYTVPNTDTYPWMWLWDSCFHSIIYATLGDDRALLEASSVFHWQTTDGMVPHMGYQKDVEFGRAAWRGNGASPLTQPPMYGHMLRVLHEWGFDVAPLIERATAGVRFILRDRRTDTGLVGVVHPWETGADNSPRWDPWCSAGTGAVEWRKDKDRFVNSLNVNEHGAAVSNSLLSVAPASFNALVAFNAHEIAAVSNDSELRREALELAETLDDQFVPDLLTWADVGSAGEVTSTVRTLDALLPVLVSPRADRVETALRLTVDPDAFGAPFGPCGVDQREATFDADAYWRGAAWPQLTYLLFVAASRSGHFDVRDALANTAIRAAVRSDFAEYLNPFTGVGHGAIPQSWACLPIAMLPETTNERSVPE
jgi:mannosylglycerate hydrolase MGH1-like protein